MRMLRQLWNDEAGFIISSELVLVATILVIGVLIGMVSLRNQVIQEVVDVGQAIGSISQSYAYAAAEGKCQGAVFAWVDGCGYRDKVDFCQFPQTPGQAPGGISLTLMPSVDWNGNPLPIDPPGSEMP